MHFLYKIGKKLSPRKVKKSPGIVLEKFCNSVFPFLYESCSLFQAYREVPKFCQYCHLRQIRGDNYCAIRGAVFQCLINNLPPFNSLSSKDCILQKLSQAFRDPSSGLKHWTFANRLPFTSKSSLDVMSSCLDSLYTKVCNFK